MKGETMEFYVYIMIVFAAYVFGIKEGERVAKSGGKAKKAKPEKINIYQI